MAAHAQATDLPAGIEREVIPWLVSRLPDWEAPLRFSRVGEGRSNLTYLVQDRNGKKVILRRPPLGRLQPKAHDVMREAHVMDKVSAAGVAAPRPLLLADAGEVLDVAFFVMERVEGTVVDRPVIAARFDEAARRRMGESLIDTLVSLHAMDVDAAGLGDLGPRDDHAGRQIRRLRRQLEGSDGRDVETTASLLDRLEATVPEQRRTVLAHGDYRLGNVIVDDRGEVRAVLDWELCALGEPLSDLGLLLSAWSDEPSEPHAFDEGTTARRGFSSRAQLARRYAAATGADLNAVPWFRALALVKLAVIILDIHRRASEHDANLRAAGLESLPSIGSLVELAGAAASESGA